MTGHVHAASMAEYAKDAAECAKPWTLWQSRCHGGLTNGNKSEWLSINCHPLWREHMEYRRIPKTIKLGDREVNAPLLVAPPDETAVAILDFCGVDDISFYQQRHSRYLALGLIFATREDAQAALDAILEMLKP